MSHHEHHWHPTWYRPEHATNWDRVKEALRRDWQQTRHDDLHVGGHELNQQATDTVKQATGKETIPSINDANPPKVIGALTGEWEAVETPTGIWVFARAISSAALTPSGTTRSSEISERSGSRPRADRGPGLAGTT